MLINLKTLVIKSLLLMVCISCLSSCASKPYEITSPCVSIDNANPYERAPCQRRPANRPWDPSWELA